MASIRELIETSYAAMAFAERSFDNEARELLGQPRDEQARAIRQAPREDKRPRVRV